MRCEESGQWPSHRLLAQLVRLPKPTSGYRLIALIQTLLRIWGRIRRSLATKWGCAHPLDSIWGVGEGRSSSDSAL
eukprot:8873737-Pyramimonas_sp.AAC.1